MKTLNYLIGTIVIACFSSITEAVEPPTTQMTSPGKLLLSEKFDKPISFAKSTTRQPHPGVWTEGWRVMNGRWTQVDNGIRGVVLPRIYPAATLHLPLDYQNVILRVDVRLDDIPLDDPPTHNSNSAKVVFREGNAAHIASAQVSKNGFSAAKDKTKEREVNGQVVDDQEVSFGKHSFDVQPGVWHTIVVEIHGDEILSTLDGENPVLGKHPIVGIPKGIVSFGTSRSASFRNLSVFEALPNPVWEKNKTAIKADFPATNKKSKPQ